jgi:fructan beta-fructosidase
MDDIYRPAFHFTPPAHWMNDPNGLVFYDGEYHLFYQHHPHSNVWGPMHWGHAVSRDLVNWQHLPIALVPDEQGMIYSGSAVVDWENTAGFGKEALVTFFTYNKNYYETQNLAYSLDKGRTWTKYEGNPVLTPPPDTPDFRDPKVIWYGSRESGHWVMSLAAGRSIRFYTSKNLREWEFSGSFSGHGSADGVWETPDLFELPVDGGPATRWVLTVGIGNGGPAGGSATQYFIGGFDGTNFQSENPPEVTLWADWGADFYAPQSWSDEPNGRRIAIAWLSNWKYAIFTPTEAEDWRSAFSVPRELSLRRTDAGIRLAQQPIAELESLRGEHRHWENVTVGPAQNLLAGLEGDQYEIIAELEPEPDTKEFGFSLRAGSDEQTVVKYDMERCRLVIDRTHSGSVDFHADFAAVHAADLALRENRLRLRILVDRCTLEVFAQDGLLSLTEAVFPSAGSRGLEFFTTGGGLKVRTLSVYFLSAARFMV